MESHHETTLRPRSVWFFISARAPARKLILVTELPNHIDRVVLEMETRGCPMHLAEESTWGVTHAEVGAYLLGLWGLPYPMVEAVANHHAPRRVASMGFDILASTYLANALHQEARAARDAQVQGRPVEKREEELDLAWLAELGVAQKIEGWRETARHQLAGEARGAAETA